MGQTTWYLGARADGGDMTVFEGHRARLDGFRRGEREVLALVYDHYVDVVATLVLRGFSSGEPPVRVPGVTAAEGQADLVQESFLKAFAPDARLAYDGLSPFRPWLLRIARNLMIDRGRRSGRLVVSSEVANASVEEAEPLPAAPEEELEWKRLREATVAFCATLDPALRRFVQLRFEEGVSQAGVAEALGMTRRKVRTLEQWVRDALRQHLESTGNVPPG